MFKQGLPELATDLSVPQCPLRSLPTGQPVSPRAHPASLSAREFRPDVAVMDSSRWNTLGDSWCLEGSKEHACEKGGGSYERGRRSGWSSVVCISHHITSKQENEIQKSFLIPFKLTPFRGRNYTRQPAFALSGHLLLFSLSGSFQRHLRGSSPPLSPVRTRESGRPPWATQFLPLAQGKGSQLAAEQCPVRVGSSMA